MEYIVPAFLILVLSIAAIVYPPAIACACALVSNSETPGLALAFAACTRVSDIVMAGICFIAVCRAIVVVRSRRKKTIPARRVYVLSIVALAVWLWMGISLRLGGSGLPDTLRSCLASGVPGVIFAAAYYRDRLARLMFLFVLIAHLSLAFAIVSFPGGPLDVMKPQLLGSYEPGDIGISATGIGKTSGQFGNPVQLAFYGAVGIIVGLYLFAYHRGPSARLMGLSLVGLGLWASYVTVERGIWIGVIIASYTVLRPLAAKRPGTVVFTILVLGALCVLCYATALDNSQAARTLFSHFTRFSEGTQYRMSAAGNSVAVLLEHPLFGVNGAVQRIVDLAGGAPHQSFYFFAVLYGLPAGIGVLLMTWWVFASKLSKRMIPGGPGFTVYDRYLAHALGWIVLFLALSNNMSAGMLGWICLGYGCLPWAYSMPRGKDARPFVYKPLSGSN
ncbi:MAG: O-antigen ligase family protein [Armatimonadota bacterium]